MSNRMKRVYNTICVDDVELGECWWDTGCDMCSAKGNVITLRVTLGYSGSEYNDVDVCPKCLRKVSYEIEAWAKEREAETE